MSSSSAPGSSAGGPCLEDDEYWDPSDPDVPDPAEGVRWHRTRVQEIGYVARAEARMYGAKLIEVNALVVTEIAQAEADIARDALELGWSQAEARRRRVRAVSLAERSAWAQIALELDISPKAAEGLAAQAYAYMARCPATLAALDRGEISSRKADTILDQTTNLSDDLRPVVEQQALEAAEGRTDEQFYDKVRRLVEKADADAVRRRAEAARAKRRVMIYPDADGMWAVKAIMPSEEAHAFYGILNAYAQETKKHQGPGDDRGIDNLRVDALMDLVRGNVQHPNVVFHAQIVVPVGTVIGTGEEPGYIPGHGPIPAEICRQLAADSEWRRLLEDPDTGNLLDIGADKYRPSVRLEEFIETRDQTCRWPGCRRRATRCHKDHTIEFRIGGRTIRINLSALCAFHHQLKHRPGWTLVQDPDGTLTFTTPAGDVYRNRPPTLGTGETHATIKIQDDDEELPF